MKKVIKFMSWVGVRNPESPEPLNIIDKSELPKLHRAAYVGYDEPLRKLLSRKKNAVDSRDKNGRTPLHLACISGCPGVVVLLIQFHCDLNARDKERTTALIRAVQFLNRRCAGILLEHGANPNLEDGSQNTALHYAILEESVSIATQLLRHNANIEAVNKSNLTPFLLAVKENKKEMVKFLIENGANVHAVDNVQRSALILAVFHDSPDIVKLLLQKSVSPYSQDSRGWSAEQYAYSNGFEHIYQLIVDYREGKIPKTPSQNSVLGQSSAEKLPSSHTGAENTQENLQLSSKDNEEDMVVELGASNDSSTDSLKSFEKKILKVKFPPRFDDLSISSVSSIPCIDDSWHSADDDADLAPKKAWHPRFAKPIQAWQEPTINTEAKDGVLKPGTSTSLEDNNSDNKNEDVVPTFPQPSTEVPGFSHPAFPAPEHLTSAAVLAVTEEEAAKPKIGGKENGAQTINSVLKEQADHKKLVSIDGAHKNDKGATSALGLGEKTVVEPSTDSESTSKIQLPNYVDQLSGAAGQGEKNTLNGQIEKSTDMHPHLKPAVGVKDSVPNKSGGMKNLQAFKSDPSDWDCTSLRPNNAAGQRAEHLKVDKCPLVSQSVTTNHSAPTELRQTALVDKEQMNIGAVSLSENAALRGLRESQLPENRSSKEADLDLEMTFKEEQEGLHGIENSQSHACTVKEKKSEGQIRQINLSPVHLQKMPGGPGMNKEQDRKNVHVSSKHTCVEKHEDMWVKKRKLDWKINTKFITKKLNQKVSKIREKCKITVLHKAESLHDNSELHGDLKKLPSNVTNNTCDSEGKDAPGASVSVGSQVLPPHEEPSLESVFPSYSKSDSAKRGCQSSSKLYLNENKLTENDKPDTEHVCNKNEEGFFTDRENEVRNRAQLLVKEDQEFDTKRKQKRSQNTRWKSDIRHTPLVKVEENRNKSGELKGSETVCDGNCCKGLTQRRKRGKTDDQQFAALQKENSDRSSKKTSAKKDKVKEQVNSVGDLDDLTLSPETASEDCESPYPNYKNTLRLIERLGLESKDYGTLLKIQNAVHSFRSLIECKESDCELLRGKVKKMENKVNKLQKELLEAREMNSQLERQNVAWERELCSMREKQYNEQVLQKQQLESTLQPLKFELKSRRDKPSQDTMNFEVSDPKDNGEVLPPQLPEAESQYRGPEIELHPRREALRPVTVLECVHRDQSQAQCSNKKIEPLYQRKQGKVNKYAAKQAFLEDRLCELQSENMLLRQQLEVAQNEAKSKTINIPEPFPDRRSKATRKQLLMLEEGNKELINECKCVKDRMYQYETDRAEMQACVRRLQQELTDTRKKVSMLEASLEVTTAHHQADIENKTQDLERKLNQIADQNADLTAKLQSTTSALLHLSAETQLLLKELLSMKGMQKKCETLQEEKKKLEEEVVNLKHHLEVNTVERSQVEQYKQEIEEQARWDVAEKLTELSQVVQCKRETEERAKQDVAAALKELSQFLQTQAAYEDNLLREYKNASISQMKHKIKYLESELKSKTFQLESEKEELEKYRQLYLKEPENRTSWASQLHSINERLVVMNTKLQMAEEYKCSVLKTIPARPAEKFNDSSEHKWTLTQSANFRSFSEPSTSMHKK
ncbi:coiled-coil domain-containing protein 144A-like isoform X3 [Vicugna pacos]|uniref:Coiled-coil domain-containing protein 144A-like isoform X3 n=1 Tax=Vicugna pacos TaxID=30538 RepID=A0ABM5DV20_VICPA